MRFVTEPERRIPVVEQVDVLVVGGGPAGLIAAIAAARNGATTALLERYGFLGGMATNALVGPLAGVRLRRGGRRVIGGIPWELIQRLREQGGALVEEGYWDVPFDPEVLKWVADQLALEAGVRLRYHTFAVGIVKNDSRLDAVFVESKSGRQALAAKVVIDATGDADVSVWAGAPYEMGCPGDGALQPMSLAFRLGGVDTARLGDIHRPYIDPDIRQLAEQWNADGKLPAFGGPWTFWGSTFRPGEVFVNMVRLWGNATSVETLTTNEITGREHIQRFVCFLRENFAPFKHCVLLDSGPQIGIRETRRIQGEYQLTGEDLRTHCHFRDSIALGGHVIDIHSPTGTHHQVTEEVGAYQIPYRCLLPQGIDNLLVCGRPISASHEAHASLRVMGTCMGTGQAAGTAAALSLREGVPPRQLEVRLLRQTLREQGAMLD